MYKKIITSIALLLVFAGAITGCTQKKSTQSSAKQSQVVKKHHKKAKKSKKSKKTNSTNIDETESQSSSNSTISSNANVTNNQTTSNTNSQSKTNSQGSVNNNQTNSGKVVTNSNSTESLASAAVNDWLKRGGYPASFTDNDLVAYISSASNETQISVAEKASGHIVANYVEKSNGLYYYDVVNNKLVKVN